jgi:putative transposase
MPIIVEVRKTYKYRLYHNDEADKCLHDAINISGIIWNHITALRKHYYHLFGKHLGTNQLKKHIAKLRMQTERFGYWKLVGSQAVQDICERHDEACERFFKKKGGLPRFKKVKKYTSFTLKQAGWKLGEDSHERGSKKSPKQTGHITLLGKEYKFVKHRPMRGDIKTVTVKRDTAGRFWVCFSVVE